MISKIVIRNYKSYKSFKLTLDPKLNIVVGDNEAGKSSLLEAINLVMTCKLDGRHITNELSPYLFNTDVVQEYVESIKSGNITELPKIIIEAYFNDPEKKYSSLKGTNNLEKEDCPGIFLTIEFDKNYEEEYLSYITDKEKITTIPIEYYHCKWFAFSSSSITYRSVPSGSIYIDTSSIKLNKGTDNYLAQTLEASDKAELSLNYRLLKESFEKLPSIKPIIKRLNDKKGTITDKELSVSVDVSQKNNWDKILTSYLDSVPFDSIGKGEQSSIKMKLAIEANIENQIILIEEPENHLSYANMNRLVSTIKQKNSEKQLILTTHSSFILNKFDIGKMILLSENKETTRFNELNQTTKDFFMKLPGYDTLRIVLSKKIILVEGPSDDLILQRAYMDAYGISPLEDGVDIYCVDALSFKRFIELSLALKKPITIVTDNDGDIEKNIYKKYKDYFSNPNFKICYEEDLYYTTLEPSIVNANKENTSVLKEIFNHPNYDDERLVQYMINNKTNCALKIFESDMKIKMPEYLLNAIKK